MLNTDEGFESLADKLDKLKDKMLLGDGALIFVGVLKLGPDNENKIEWEYLRHHFPNADLPEARRRFAKHIWDDLMEEKV